MAHMIESVNGKAQMAYAGETPWHGLGTKVPADLTPAQMLEAAGLNWTVEKVPAFAKVGGKQVAIGQSALVRSMDDSILDVVSDDWNPVQNEEAFDFFNEFVAAGDMEMHTAGSLQDGKIVWGLAKVKESFELFKGDQIYGCDHGVTFHEEYKLRTVLWQFADKKLTEEELQLLRTFDCDLSEYLTNVEIEALSLRIGTLIKEERFPLPPTDWPAIPWPPF